MATNSTNSVGSSQSNNTFQVGVSLNGSTQKPRDKEIAALRFAAHRVSRDTLVDFISKGHSLCHNFGHGIGQTFSHKERTKERFTFANMVMIDVDDSTVDMTTLVDSLCLTPSIAFTTYSNGVKGYRFRLVYLFSDSLNSEEYKAAYLKIVKENNLTLTDNCMKSFVQCSFGNGSGNVEIITSDEVYSLNQLGVDRCVEKPHNCLPRTNKKNDTSLIALSSQKCGIDITGVVEELKGKKWEEYLDQSRGKYERIEKTQLDFNEYGYALLDDSYVEIRWPWFLDYYEVRGERRIRPARKKIRDGEKRHRKLYNAALLRRLIKPSISIEELVYNAIGDVMEHFDNSDGKFTTTKVIETCARVMAVENININPIKDKRRFCLDPNVYTTREERRHARRAVQRHITDSEIVKFYDNTKTDTENLAVLKENGVEICRQRLTQYKKDHGIKSMTKADQIGNLYDPSLSEAKNLEVFKQYGLVVSLRALQKWKSENGLTRKNKNRTIDHSEQINNNVTSLDALSSQKCGIEENKQPVEETKEEPKTFNKIIKVINQLDKKVKPGYSKRDKNLNEFMKPLAPAIKEVDVLTDAETAFAWFNQTITVLQYNTLDDQMTIKAYTKLFINKIESLKTA